MKVDFQIQYHYGTLNSKKCTFSTKEKVDLILDA